MKILVVEDTVKLAQYVAQMLTEAGYIVDVVHTGPAGEARAQSGEYDLMILDLLLPEKNGLDVCITLRSENNTVPILMLTALGETADRILGLDSGADDYLVKPFEMTELLARVRALLRRPAEQFVTSLVVGSLELEPTTRVVRVDGETVNLTVKEFVVLEYLMRHAGTVVTREQLLEHCWDFAYSAFSNITDVYIKQLRKKLHDTDQERIKTIRGVGYTLVN
jgi:DNA-binding response OmpR family regulator